MDAIQEVQEKKQQYLTEIFQAFLFTFCIKSDFKDKKS